MALYKIVQNPLHVHTFLGTSELVYDSSMLRG